MAIIETITQSDRLYHDLQETSDYKYNFSYEGARALLNYLDELSSDCDDNIEYDPIGWCCEFSEYDDFDAFQEQHTHLDLQDIDDLRDYTQVIEFDGGIIIADF